MMRTSACIFFLAAHPVKGAVLKYLEQLDLGRWGNGSDFIQKDGAVFRDFKHAQFAPDSPGERTFFVPEQFRFPAVCPGWHRSEPQ